MDNQILNKTIKISSVETKAGQNGNFHKIKDENNLTYTIFQTKQDGNETVAYQGFKTKQVGDLIDISFKEEQKEYQGKPYTQRTILGVKQATGTPTPNMGARTATPQPAPQEDKMTKADWDKKSFGMCKHAFLVEAYKLYIKSRKEDAESWDLNQVEREAEEWAKMSMRKLDEQLSTPPEGINPNDLNF